MNVIPQCGKGFISESTFVVDSFVIFSSLFITCINICAHVKDHVIHVRVQWTVETVKIPSMHRRLGCQCFWQILIKGGPRTPSPVLKLGPWGGKEGPNNVCYSGAHL